MTSFKHIAILALIAIGAFANDAVNDDPILEREAKGLKAQGLYQQQVIINPQDDPACSGTVCNYSKIQDIVFDEVKSVKLELGQIKESVSELVELLKKTPVTPPTSPKDCSEAFTNGATASGVYTVQPEDDGSPFEVYCDMETDGGGWTVFQRRQDGSVDFYLGWESYRQGFGNLDGEFWLGNDNLHRLTAQGDYRLRVDLEDFENNTRYAVYNSFRVANASTNYQLTVGNYSGTAGDSLLYHNNQAFSTRDRDNDSSSGNCATGYAGSWWYNACFRSNLNANYLRGQTSVYGKGVVWRSWRGYYYSLKHSEMKIKA
ncbi:ficolin-1-like isoform X1 [Acanthaster planci]|uniref:Ficolin-1-like isoform X1 n=1 Tax=Acanthaster planci TaxID=133434 RepID=A0A8B7YWI2_ACAPL|nr:ficolin-1-like isoform X1 [Acanthaster planci]XP_022097047.1 ficolin-1-like isoform X1 [Acanthaster planci]